MKFFRASRAFGICLILVGLAPHARAWFDVPVRASRVTIDALKAQGIDLHELADALRVAADPEDIHAGKAQAFVHERCGCRWSVEHDAAGEPFIRLQLAAVPAHADSVEIEIPAKATPSTLPPGKHK